MFDLLASRRAPSGDGRDDPHPANAQMNNTAQAGAQIAANVSGRPEQQRTMSSPLLLKYAAIDDLTIVAFSQPIQHDDIGSHRQTFGGAVTKHGIEDLAMS